MANKFCYTPEQDAHWLSCRESRLPFVMIDSTTGDYHTLHFDVLPTMPNRGAELDYLDLLEPLYDFYWKQGDYPALAKESGGGSRNGFFKVAPAEAPALAEKLFDLLVIMTKRDDARYAEKLLEGKREIYLS
jgi:hypothetical protein